MNIALIGQPGDGSEFNPDTNTIGLNPQEAFEGNPITGESAGSWLQHTIVHEAAHGLIWGLAQHNELYKIGMDQDYGNATGWTSKSTNHETIWHSPGNGPTTYANNYNPAEDYADSVSVLIYPWIPNMGVTQDRIDWINGNIRGQ